MHIAYSTSRDRAQQSRSARYGAARKPSLRTVIDPSRPASRDDRPVVLRRIAVQDIIVEIEIRLGEIETERPLVEIGRPIDQHVADVPCEV